MKRKILWVGLSLLLVVMLVLSSCAKEVTPTTPTAPAAPAAPTAPTTPAAPAAPAAGEPRYGGNLTFMSDRSLVGGPASFDPAHPSISTIHNWCWPYMESLIIGDVEKYGPRGTNEFAFRSRGAVPEEYFGGCLAESWEITQNPIVMTFHIRPGVMFAANDYIGFEAREVTAYDVEQCFRRNMLDNVAWQSWYYWVDSITATDKYTLVVDLNKWFANWTFWLGGGLVLTNIYPPEAVDLAGGNLNGWKSAVGTGAYIITKYVENSQAVYTRNPDYWDKTIIKGKEYQIPFSDTLTYPIILDESTAIAALRTGKVDIWNKVPLVYDSTLTNTCPELIKMKAPSDQGHAVQLHSNAEKSPILSDYKIRQALSIATDFQTIIHNEYIDGDLIGYPIPRSFTAMYMDLPDLPEDIQVLYSHNPDLAKQMIADAGYPNGFHMVMNVLSNPYCTDIASMLVEQWGKVGVTVEVHVQDSATMLNMHRTETFDDALLSGASVGSVFTTLSKGLMSDPGNDWEDPYEDELYTTMMSTIDPVERSRLMQVQSLHRMEYVPYIYFGNPYILSCYWPWVENYYQEFECGCADPVPILARIWIDQDLKKELGY